MGHTCLKCPQPVTWTVFPIFEITQESPALVISVQANVLHISLTIGITTWYIQDLTQKLKLIWSDFLDSFETHRSWILGYFQDFMNMRLLQYKS